MGVPKGFNTLSSYLIVSDAPEAIELYKKAFGAEGGSCLTMPDGSIMHAEMKVGDSTFMLTQENPAWEQKSPTTLGGSPVSMHMYVESAEAVDALFKQATDAGMTVIAPPTDMFWGDRYAKVVDRFGHMWGIATQTKELTDEEMATAMNGWLAEMAAQGGGPPEGAEG